MSHTMAVIAGPASATLGTEVSAPLQAHAVSYECDRFPDGETHALVVGCTRDNARSLPIAHLIAGNTVAIENSRDLPLDVTSVAPLIAAAIRREHDDESLVDLRVHR